MPISYQAGESFDSGGNFLKVEGWYHLLATDATDTVTKRDGSLVPDAMFRVTCQVCAGSSPGCEDKMIDLTFFFPNPEKPEFGQKVNDRSLVAMNVLDPSDIGKAVEFEAADLIGQQFIAHLELDQNGKYLRLAFADIFHIDDPEVSGQPKNEGMLGLIKPSDRRIGSQKPKPAAKPTPAMAAASEPMNVDDLDI